MVFEHAMQADHGDGARVKGPLNLDRLGKAVRDATGAEHLEGVEHNDATAQFTEREGCWRIEPE